VSPERLHGLTRMGSRLVIVGLGPAGTDLLLPRALRALEGEGRRIARTRRHPAVADLEADGLEFESFDDVYEAAADLPTAYVEMVDALLAAVRDGDVVYAVPGNPVVAERSVQLVRDAALAAGIAVEIVPGLSFADLAWAHLGVDPMTAHARLVDARSIAAEELAGPVLVAQCDSPLVLSDVKLALLERLDGDDLVTVLQRLGLPDERITTIALAELDRAVAPDHLTSVFADVPGARAGTETTRLLSLARRLRNPGGCPWDAEQTHHSLTRYLLEEAYEVVEAVEALPLEAPAGAGEESAGAYVELADELGDLLYQVVFHAVLAEEAGAFTFADVARVVHDKLVRRHPHVFGDVIADETADVMRNWEQIKKGERGTTSIVAGITPGLPSLLYTHKLFRKAASIGLDPGSGEDALGRIEDAAARAQRGEGVLETELAELLAAAVVLARAGGVDAESALRGWAARYRDRFEAMERLAAEQGVDLAGLDLAAVEELWRLVEPGGHRLPGPSL
jgi:tetrapyrrole methylase family protein / MazG family protein